MFPKTILLFFIGFFLMTALQSQDTYQVRCIIKDAVTKEPLSDVLVYFSGTEKRSARSTDRNGFVTCRIDPAIRHLVINTDGYHPDTILMPARPATDLLVLLRPVQNMLQEVMVQASPIVRSMKNEFAGNQKLTPYELQNMAVLFGEKDIMKSMQTLPGIKNAGEGSSGVFVRGGSTDQNLILLDGATVYNASHLLGFFSIFNSDIIRQADIHKGAVPAEYGGRLSSLINIKTVQGDTSQYQLSGGIGLIASRLNVEGPVIKDRVSFLLSARRSYPDQYLFLSGDPAVRYNKLHFSDYNGNLYARLNRKNEVYLTWYNGTDHFALGSLFGIQYGNTVGQLRLKHLYGRSFSSNTSFILSNYQYHITIRPSNYSLAILSAIKDITVKHEFQKDQGPITNWKLGFDVTAHTIHPVSIQAANESGYNSIDPEIRRSVEANVYLSRTKQVNARTILNYGLRLNAFSIMGPGNYYSIDSMGNPYNFLYYKAFQLASPLLHLEPRISVNYEIDSSQLLKFSYTRNTQNIHMVSNSTSTNPTDLYLATNNNIRPELADQFSFGYFKNMGGRNYEISAELYYKRLQNQIDYKNGSMFMPNQQVESMLTFGEGRAYGFELLVRKKRGMFTGWIGYTLSKTERRFSSINNGNWFNARQDRPHEISVVTFFQPSRKWIFSASWVYYTGNPVTVPVAKYWIGNEIVYYYSARNQNRMPDYHRLDLAVTYYPASSGKNKSNWTLSIYNAYNRENAYSINFQDDPNSPGKTQAMQTTLFKIVPSVTYNFKF